MSYPVVRILEGHDRRLRSGSPWLFSNELQIDRAAKELPPGSIVRLAAQDGKAMALAHFNAHSLIAARLLTRNTEAVVDQAFIARRLRRAVAIRARLFDRPFYRLVNAEADGLPGLVIDRFGDLLVIQLNTAGMEAMGQAIETAAREVTGAAGVHVRADTQGRALEGLDPGDAEAEEAAPTPVLEPIIVEENGLAFRADPVGGQKTGWYYDQRANRAFTSQLAAEAAVLDLYSYAGGFGLLSLAAGARSACLVDRSAPALELAQSSAELQGSSARLETICADVYPTIDRLVGERRRFGLVIADPPPFVRARKDLPAGLKGYQKLAKGAASLTAEGGYLAIACCSHNVPEAEFLRASYAGIRAAGRAATLLRNSGADVDHPVHPALPESAYLKFLAFALD